jgi:2-methylcitrate dehydratase PrpD
VHGRVGLDEITEPALGDERVRRLVGAMSLREDAALTSRFPAERWARVRIVLADGRTLVSEARTRGDPDTPLDDAEIAAKYHALADPVLGGERAARIEAMVAALATDTTSIRALHDELLQA